MPKVWESAGSFCLNAQQTELLEGRTDFLRRVVGVTHKKLERKGGNHQRVKNNRPRHLSAAEIKVNIGLSA